MGTKKREAPGKDAGRKKLKLNKPWVPVKNPPGHMRLSR